MENSQQLATESFSYSWLTDRQPYPTLSEYSPNHDHQKDHNFNFDVPLTEYSPAVHADDIFSGGHIMPVYIAKSSSKKPVALKRTASEISAPSSPIIYSNKTPFFAKKKSECFLFEKWRKSSNKFFSKCFGFVKPLCKSRKSNRVDDLERKVFELSIEASPTRSISSAFEYDWSNYNVKNNNIDKFDFYYGLKKAKSWSSSPQASPVISPSRTSNSWCDVESSINEAILHCKRSIEK